MKVTINGKVTHKFDDNYGGLNLVVDDGATKIPVRFTGYGREEGGTASVGDAVSIDASLGSREKDGRWFTQVDGGRCKVTEKGEEPKF